MNNQEVMQMALEALENVRSFDVGNLHGVDDEIQSLRDRLAQPKREWVGLTDEEIDYLEDVIDPAMYRVFARRIEAKLKEKNT
jgi:hypothetical protein